MPLDDCNMRRYKWRMMKHPLELWLAEKGMSKTQFAASVGISRMAIWRIVTGKQGLTLSMLRKVASATGIPVSSLIGDGEPAQ